MPCLFRAPRRRKHTVHSQGQRRGLCRRRPGNTNRQRFARTRRNRSPRGAANDSAQGQNLLIRGRGKESIVLLVDGMRFNSAQPVGATVSFMTQGLTERVEVVRGTTAS
ncbi:TonB-dependent receptor plug domain-containing protein [Azonexus sp.]|uniref:TonB-dependent receptor plug domain-containing protein n=1 Tax=Azonexus sp. TaxID=1872668 RepID=UPI0035AEE3BB